MAALSILLDQLAGYPWPRPEHPADPYVLTVDNDIVISLYETSDERIDFYSSPGYVHDAPWLKNEFPRQLWGYDARDEEVHPDIVRSIRIDPHTGQVLLIDSWPRAALDIVGFRERLAYFTEVVRLWRRAIQAD